MADDSPYLTAAEAAAFVKARSLKAFDHWVNRRGIDADARRGRIRLYLPRTLQRVLENDAKPWRPRMRDVG